MKFEYCKHCGKQNPEGSKFCQHCGKNVEDSTIFESIKIKQTVGNQIDQDTKPYPYVISIWKLISLSIVTLGIYNIYWFYRQWKSFNAENDLKHNGFILFIYALFAPLSSYSLFKNISQDTKKQDSKGLESGALALVYFFTNQFSLGFLALIPVQNEINTYWERKYSDRLIRSNFGLGNWIVIILITITAIYALSLDDNSTYESDSSVSEADIISNYNQEEIRSSVVNILCPSTIADEESSGGSGVILTKDGVILTNSHIIPQDAKELHVDKTGCLVVLPDSSTGQPSEMFLANPIVIPGLSDDYDLAYMKIYNAYYDEELGEYSGTYPREFPTFNYSNSCSIENIQLGDHVRILGYPAISGGYSLTVTDGIVSSFPGDGLIVTSAKISHGNSGGLAINKDGCMIGVPSLVSSDENESLGVIYSVDLIREFESKALEYLESSE